MNEINETKWGNAWFYYFPNSLSHILYETRQINDGKLLERGLEQSSAQELAAVMGMVSAPGSALAARHMWQ